MELSAQLFRQHQILFAIVKKAPDQSSPLHGLYSDKNAL